MDDNVMRIAEEFNQAVTDFFSNSPKITDFKEQLTQLGFKMTFEIAGYIHPIGTAIINHGEEDDDETVEAVPEETEKPITAAEFIENGEVKLNDSDLKFLFDITNACNSGHNPNNT